MRTGKGCLSRACSSRASATFACASAETGEAFEWTREASRAPWLELGAGKLQAGS